MKERNGKKKGMLCLCLVLMSVLMTLTGCRSENAASDAESGKLKVVTTLFPYYDFTRQIAGDLVDLSLVIPAGMDSHSFEPTPTDIRMIENADIMIANGGHMEHWVSQVTNALNHSDLRTVYMMNYVEAVEEEVVEGMEHNHVHSHVHAGAECTLDHDHSEDYAECTLDHDHSEDYEECTLDHDHSEDYAECTLDHDHSEDYEECTLDHDHEQFHGEDESQYEIEYDEHIWTSPVNAMKITEAIAEVLKEADPDHTAVYEENKNAYLNELSELDEKFRTVREEADFDIMIMGDKFPLRYFADEYDLRYRAAFSGCSSDTEPSAKTIAYLIDKMKSEELPVIYYLELSSHRVSEIIAEETGAKPLLFHSCHNVTRREFEEGITYLELMEQNVISLREGLCR